MSIACLAASSAALAQARQEVGSIKVAVRDSSGIGIAGAELTIPGSMFRGESDAQGIVMLNSVAYGPVTVRVRRLGFRPAAVEVLVEPGTAKTVDVTLARAAQSMTPIVVTGGRKVYSGRMAGFNQRRDLGNGRYFTRDEIEKLNPAFTTDIMRRVPGVRLINRGMIRNAVRFRNNSCAPLVYLDGSPLSAAEFDIDAINPLSIEGMEIYSGVATVPMQFSHARGLSTCGVIAIWSREGEARKKRPKGTSAAQQLAQAVESLMAFTADQVDMAAHTDSAHTIRPIYPDSLYQAGASGLVVAEFIVNANGDVEIDDFNVLSSTHPLFTEAVRTAVRYAEFVPAVRQGRQVRQVVQLPFRFVRDSTAAPQKGKAP